MEPYFLKKKIGVRVASTEYTPYFDLLERLRRDWTMVPSTAENRFTPSVADYLGTEASGRSLILMSNPCNPTGITRSGDELRALVEAASSGTTGVLVDARCAGHMHGVGLRAAQTNGGIGAAWR